MQQNSLTIDISYLKPLELANHIEHEAYYIKHGENQKGTRKIYENVKYDAFEEQLVLDLENECIKQNIIMSDDWKKSDYLKMQYSGKCKLKDSIKKLQIHLLWRADPANHCLNQKSLEFLKQGIIYTHGRDRQYRPIIILNAYMVDLKKHDKDMIVQALSYLMGSVRKYMMIPGKVENWIFILETNKIGVFGLPLKGLGVIIDCMSVNFCGCLDKMYILNPSGGLDFTWGAIQGLIDAETKQKINFVSAKTMEKLKEKVDPDQLEKKYGGTRENLTMFWPPINLDLKDGYTPISTNTHIEKKILLLDVDLVKGFDKSHGLPVEQVQQHINFMDKIDDGPPESENQISNVENQEMQGQQGQPKKIKIIAIDSPCQIGKPHIISIMDVDNHDSDSHEGNSQPLQSSHGHISQFATFGKLNSAQKDTRQIVYPLSVPVVVALHSDQIIEEATFQNEVQVQNKLNVRNCQEQDQMSFNNGQFEQQERLTEIDGDQRTTQAGCCSRATCILF